jgi:hypothetical protein
MGHPRFVDAALGLAWLSVAAIAATALVMLGYVGYLMILVWGAVAVPLAFVTAHRLRSSGRRLDPACGALALRSYTLLAVATVLVHALLMSDRLGHVGPGASEALGMVAGMGMTILFVGQVGYVLAATQWFIRALARARPSDDASRSAV